MLCVLRVMLLCSMDYALYFYVYAVAFCTLCFCVPRIMLLRSVDKFLWFQIGLR